MMSYENSDLNTRAVNQWASHLSICFFSRVPTAGIEVFVKNKYHCLTRVSDNFFVGANLGKVSFPLRVRLTSITGEQVVAAIRELKNGVSLQSGVQFKGFRSGSK